MDSSTCKTTRPAAVCTTPSLTCKQFSGSWYWWHSNHFLDGRRIHDAGRRQTDRHRQPAKKLASKNERPKERKHDSVLALYEEKLRGHFCWRLPCREELQGRGLHREIQRRGSGRLPYQDCEALGSFGGPQLTKSGGRQPEQKLSAETHTVLAGQGSKQKSVH